jgi:hypothetical protein
VCNKFAQECNCSAFVRTEDVVRAAREAVTILCRSFQRNGFGVQNYDEQKHDPGLPQANDEIFVLSFQVRLEFNFQVCGTSLYHR